MNTLLYKNYEIKKRKYIQLKSVNIPELRTLRSEKGGEGGSIVFFSLKIVTNTSPRAFVM